MAFTTLWLYNNLAQGNARQLCVLCPNAYNEGHSSCLLAISRKGTREGTSLLLWRIWSMCITYVLVFCFCVISSLVPSCLYLNSQGWCKHFIIYLTFWLTRFSIICLLCVGLNLRLCLLLVLVIDMCVRKVDGFFLMVRSCR